MTGVIKPPDNPPEDEAVQWLWIRQAYHSAYWAKEEITKIRAELARLQNDLSSSLGQGFESVQDCLVKIQTLESDLENLNTEIEEKMIKPLTEIQAQRNQMKGGWVVFLGVVVFLSQILGSVIVAKLLGQ